MSEKTNFLLSNSQQISQILFPEEFTTQDNHSQTDSCGIKGGCKIQINYTWHCRQKKIGSKFWSCVEHPLVITTQVTSLWSSKNCIKWIFYPHESHFTCFLWRSARCSIWVPRSRDYEEFCLLGHNIMESGESQLMFWRNMLPPSSLNRATCIILVSCLAYSSTLKLEAICASETLVDLHWTT
jgi:hypothetical protein